MQSRAEALAEALSLADANYQAAKDPDLNEPAFENVIHEIGAQLATVPVWVWLLVTFVLYLRFFHRMTGGHPPGWLPLDAIKVNLYAANSISEWADP